MSDFFYSTKLLRFKKDGQYHTVTASVEKNFMFGISVTGINLSAPVRYFDVQANLISYSGPSVSQTNFPMVQCTKEHLQALPELYNNFDSFYMNTWLCPPLGSSYELFGKISDPRNQVIGFTVLPCNNATDPSRTCQSQAAVDALFAANANSLYFTYYFINSVINADSVDYIDYYLEDKNYAVFGANIAVDASIEISDYTINSDNSILPFKRFQQDHGFFVKDKALMHPYDWRCPTSPVNFPQKEFFSGVSHPGPLYIPQTMMEQ